MMVLRVLRWLMVSRAMLVWGCSGPLLLVPLVVLMVGVLQVLW